MATKPKTAIPHKYDAGMVLTHDRGSMSRAKAKELGYDITGADAQNGTEPDNANAATLEAHKAWRSSVLALPEARDRESAAVEIVMTQTAETMTVASARAFLRGLPVEQTQEETTTMTTDNANPERAARLAEINGGMLAFNKQRGYGEARKTNSQDSQSRGASLADVDQTKLRRLSQIRLNALENGTAHEASAGETKKLRYALSVTGMALADVFAQLSVDTSKLRI
jgi:hypothetical protein